MGNLTTYSHIAMTGAAILPVVAMVGLVIINRINMRRIDAKLAEMRELESAMREMVAAPARIRAMAKEMRDSVTRIQQEEIK